MKLKMQDDSDAAKLQDNINNGVSDIHRSSVQSQGHGVRRGSTGSVILFLTQASVSSISRAAKSNGSSTGECTVIADPTLDCVLTCSIQQMLSGLKMFMLCNRCRCVAVSQYSAQKGFMGKHNKVHRSSKACKGVCIIH